MSDPASYRICVQGRVEQSWRGRLGGMAAEEAVAADGNVVTTLTGALADQAALTGVLQMLYGLHLPVLSAERIADVPEQDIQDAPSRPPAGGRADEE